MPPDELHPEGLPLAGLPTSDPPAKLRHLRARLVAINDVLAGVTSAEQVAATLGVTRETVHLWLRGATAAVAPDDARLQGTRASEPKTLRDALQRVYGSLEARYLDKDALFGVSSGFYDLDHLLGGFKPGTLNVLAGRPAMGRTSLALAFAHSCAAQKAPVLFNSAEASQDTLVTRLLGTRAQVNSHRLRTGYLAEKDWERLTAAIGELTELPIVFINDPTLTVADLRANARRLHAEQGAVGLIVVDPLEMLRAGVGGDTESSFQSTAHSLKRLARELDTAVLAIAPVAGAVEGRRDHRPTLADVRGGEALLELADVVMLLYREAYYHPESAKRGSAEVIVARHRQGPVGRIELYFDDTTQRFASVSARLFDDP